MEMKTVDLSHLGLQEVWSESDPKMRARVHFPFFAGAGTESSTLAYFELQPGCRLGTHSDNAEEILLPLAGTIEATVGQEQKVLFEGDAVLIPAGVQHSFRNPGNVPARCVGFFSRSTVENTFKEPVMPYGCRVVGTSSVYGAVSQDNDLVAVDSDTLDSPEPRD
jgi:quercetin dioxygenase-like cupin family protein